MTAGDYYGVVRFTGGPHKGELGYYDDDDDSGKAIVYLGVPLFSDYVLSSRRQLKEATEEETRVYEEKYLNDEVYGAALRKASQEFAAHKPAQPRRMKAVWRRERIPPP